MSDYRGRIESAIERAIADYAAGGDLRPTSGERYVWLARVMIVGITFMFVAALLLAVALGSAW